MGHSGVFISCVNSDCQSNEFLPIIMCINLEVALETADLLNQIQTNDTKRCDICGDKLIHKPFNNH